MSIQADVVLDSGFFIPNHSDSDLEIGYYESETGTSDLAVYVDGEELESPEPFKLGLGLIEVRHYADGIVKRDGPRASAAFRERLLNLKDLYGENVHVEHANFDCVIRFDSGDLRPSMVKRRSFKEHKKQLDGSYKYDLQSSSRELLIAHNVIFQYALEPGESLELARDGIAFWNSENYPVLKHLEIEILADNSTTEKFYRHAFSYERDSYWLPNQGDPPPVFGGGGALFIREWNYCPKHGTYSESECPNLPPHL